MTTGCHTSRHTTPSVSTIEKKKTDVKRGGIRDKLIAESRRWLGTKYRYGGQSRSDGTDCSGMVMVIYRDVAGVKLPRSSAEQQKYTKRIDRRNLLSGDLIFFATKAGGNKVGHVGIYIGEDKFIHASSSRGVMISGLDEKYYVSHLHSYGRVESIDADNKKKKEDGGKKNIIPELTLEEYIRLNRADSTTVDSVTKPEEPVALPDSITSIILKAFAD